MEGTLRRPRDAAYMRRALQLAARAEGFVSPRPPVGCVIVSGDEVVGEGVTEPRPGPHAEVAALQGAGSRARGATAYVSLEPCSHHSITGPCADALIEAGVARVVAGCRDPYPEVRGRGFARLRRAGIEVRTGVLRDAARRLIEPFETWSLRGRPFVTLKVAASLDGKVAAPDGTSRWITGEQARRQVHELRERADAVMVGAGTVSADDPALTVRLPEARRQPARVLVDSSGRTPATARIFDGSAPAFVLTTRPRPDLELVGATVFVVDAAEGGVDLRAGLAALGEAGLCHVVAESGPRLSASLVAEGLVDRMVLYLAPKAIGGGEAPGMLASGVKTLADAYAMRFESVARVGDDVRIDLRP